MSKNWESVLFVPIVEREMKIVTLSFTLMACKEMDGLFGFWYDSDSERHGHVLNHQYHAENILTHFQEMSIHISS